MFAWIAVNLPTILICLGLAAAVAAIIISLVRNRKKGRSACGCGCQGCAMSGSCHKQGETQAAPASPLLCGKAQLRQGSERLSESSSARLYFSSAQTRRRRLSADRI